MKKLTILVALMLCIAIPASCLALGETGKDYTEYEPLYTLAEDNGFRMGACYSYYQMSDQAFLGMMSYHYNSLTPTNELKAYSLLNQQMSKVDKNGMPGINWYQADKMLAWAQANGMKVRGHVLVWDAYMTDWFFRVDYSNTKPYADPETCRARLEYYIREVITHCETNFPGVVYCWDVVNEAVGDSASEYELSDPRHLRTTRGGATNLFRDLVGDDYVEFSFLCAKNVVEELNADITLFYNDYNTFNTGKRTAIVALVSSVNSYATDEAGNPRQLCDGVGMQCYIGGYGTQSGCMSSTDIESIRQTILLFGSMGLQVHITEMAIRNYSDDPAQIEKHAAYCGQLFTMLAGINTEEQTILTCVAMWGAFDCNSLPTTHYTWKLNSPYCGLFTEQYAVKGAFEAVYEALR